MMEEQLCSAWQRRSGRIYTGLFVVTLFIAVPVGYASVINFKEQDSRKEQCDLFRGGWIPNSLEPPYSRSCHLIDDIWNCLNNGRPDEDYLHWRWRPYSCDLPLFDSEVFLSVMKDKAFAFVGDSLARNQRESLLCLLSKVEEPELIYKHEWTSTWYFPSYNFTVATIWSRSLLQDDSTEVDNMSLHLDILDNSWTGQYHNFDYVLLTTGPWFNKSSVLFENNTIVGCHNCNMENVRELGVYYPFQRAIELAFRFITASDHKPMVIYRSHSPSHFEHGRFNEGGYCNRTEPSINVGEFVDEEQDRRMYAIGVNEFKKAVDNINNIREKNGAHLEMLDIYHLSLFRPDGHPNKYRGHGPFVRSDCLHWCLPGPIDTWNDLMMEMVLRNEDLSHSA